MVAIKIIRSIFIQEAEKEMREISCDDLYVDHCMTIVNPSSGEKTKEKIYSECIQNLIDYIMNNFWGADIRDVTGEDMKWLLSNIKFKEPPKEEEGCDMHIVLQGVYEDKENDDIFVFKYQYML